MTPVDSPAARTPGPPVLEVQGLVVRYGATTAVDGVSLRVTAGETVALLGANGAGKTSTLEAVLGLRPAATGRVLRSGLSPDSPRAHERTGVMLQSGGLPPAGRPLAWLRHLAVLYGSDRDPAALLNSVGIDPATRTAHRRLSGGEQQRVKLAAALLPDSDLLVLDEPTAGVDLEVRDRLLELIRDRAQSGAGVLLTSHVLADITELADRVVVLRQGRVVASGTLAEVTGAEQGLTIRLDRHVELDALSELLRGRGAVSETSDGRLRILGAHDPALLADLTAWCAAQGIVMLELERGRTSLAELLRDPSLEQPS